MASPDAWRLDRFREFLAAFDEPSFAALLRELGRELYNREIERWRVFVDVSDELLDRATFAARKRLVRKGLERRGLATGKGGR